MELHLSVVDPRGGPGVDVVVAAEPDMSVRALAIELARLLGEPTPSTREPALFVAGVPVPGDLPLGGSPVREGVRVSLAGPSAPRVDGQGLVELRVVGGPDAGTVHRLGPSAAIVGSGPDAWVRIADSALAEAALEVSVGINGDTRVRPLKGTSAALEGASLGEPAVDWEFGNVVAVGESLLELCPPAFPDAALRPSEDGGGLAFNRPPRIAPPSPATMFRLPTVPKPSDARPFPWAMALLPLVGAVSLALLRGSTLYLFMALLTPLVLVGSYSSDRRHGRRSHRRARAEFEAQKVSIEYQARRAMAQETAVRRAAAPDPAAVLLVAAHPTHRLWERRPADADHGVLRVGTGSLPSEVEVHDPNSQEHRRSQHRDLAEVPVTVDLRAHGVVGVAGRGSTPRALARWLVAQAAVLHGPDDLAVCVLTDRSARRDWEWVRWLPHARARRGQDAVALIGHDAESVARRITEVLALITARRNALRDPSGLDPAAGRPWAGPLLLLVVDGSRRLRAIPGLAQILREGPLVGVHPVCLDGDRRLLPEECRAVVDEDHHGRIRVERAGLPPVHGVRPDCVSPEWCERVARALCPIRDVAEPEGSGLPDACRLLDVLGLEPPTAEAVAARWLLGGRSTAAPVGVSLDGPFVVDLVRDGPHGLVAGTTGSGKSELLRTLVASLAAVNRPDAMNFVLVDYKGGAAFKDCVRLPHTVGMVTDLDAHLVRRALVSLGAELRRREHILAAAGTADIDDHLAAARRDATLAPLPRLLIVIDEFASMARELPDFVSGLVDVAQRGRSLGIHLVLATQRPSGVVSPEIRANTNLRVALRVTDAADSQDVIDTADAGRIPKSAPGRGYARLGASSPLPFQAARVGGRRPGPSDAAASVPWAAPVDWEGLARTLPARPVPRSRDDEVPTDLAVLVEAVQVASRSLGFAPPHRPWLPALGVQVTVDELPIGIGRLGDVAPVVFGVTDVPGRQAREALALDPADGGHLLLVGGPRSGRSTALRTIAGALAASSSPGDMHLYGVDCASNALLPLARLPHCGCVVSRDQPQQLGRLLARLAAEVARRQQFLAAHGMTGTAEQRAAAPAHERLPWLVLLLDGWEGYHAAFETYEYGALIDALKRLLQDGPSVGLKVVMSADRSGLSSIVSSSFADRLVLRLADPADYASAGLTARDLPVSMPPGRAVQAVEAGVRESQIALLAADPSGHAQTAALHRIGDAARAAHGPPPPHLRPMRVDALPARMTMSEALALRPEFVPPSDAWALLGVGGDELAPLGVDLAVSGPGFVIAGPPRSGRSTVLGCAARTLLRGGLPLVLVLPRRSPLRELADEPGVLGVLGSDAAAQDLRQLASQASDGRYAVLVDDAELLYDTALDTALEEVIRGGGDSGRCVVAAGTTDAIASQYRGFLTAARRSMNGMLLSPQGSSDGELFKVHLGRNPGGGPTGRGLLIRDGRPVPIQATAAD